MRTLVVGLGKHGFADASVGVRVARELKLNAREGPELKIVDSCAGGAELLDGILGWKRAIIIDCVKSPRGVPGRFSRMTIEHYTDTMHASDRNGLPFATAVAVGMEKFPEKMPEMIIIFAVEVEDPTTRSDSLTPRVKLALPAIVKAVLAELGVSASELVEGRKKSQ